MQQLDLEEPVECFLDDDPQECDAQPDNTTVIQQRPSACNGKRSCPKFKKFRRFLKAGDEDGALSAVRELCSHHECITDDWLEDAVWKAVFQDNESLALWVVKRLRLGQKSQQSIGNTCRHFSLHRSNHSSCGGSVEARTCTCFHAQHEMAFRIAVKRNNTKLLRVLFQGYKAGSLIAAVRRNDAKMVEFLLKNGANPNERDCDGSVFRPRKSRHVNCSYALTAAGDNQYSEIFKLLLKHGADAHLALEQLHFCPGRGPSCITSFMEYAPSSLDKTTATHALISSLVDKDSKRAAVLTMRHGASVDDALALAAHQDILDALDPLVAMGAKAHHATSGGFITAEDGPNRLGRGLNVAATETKRLADLNLLELRGLRMRFMAQCKSLAQVLDNLPHLVFRFRCSYDLKLDHVGSHRHIWRLGIEALRRLAYLFPVNEAASTLSVLCVAKAMIDLIKSRNGTDYEKEFISTARYFSDNFEGEHPSYTRTMYVDIIESVWGFRLDALQTDAAVPQTNTSVRQQHLEFLAKLLLEANDLIEIETPAPESSESNHLHEPSGTPPHLDAVHGPPPTTFSPNEPTGRPPDPTPGQSDSSSPPPVSSERPYLDLLREKTKDSTRFDPATVQLVTGGLFAVIIMFIYGTSSKCPLSETLVQH